MKLATWEIIEATEGKLLQGNPSRVWTRVSTDSRTLPGGALFWALKGPRFDGHDFVGHAARRGAEGAVVERERASKGRWEDLPADFTLIQVEDSLKALGDAASAWRSRVDPLVVGITGSGGKTTTKEMVAGILSQGGKVLKNQGNFNNLVGLPLTLLQLEPQHTVAVVEMGMNTPGEIARLCQIAAPRVGLITNIHHAHVGRLGSIENIARAKGEMLPYLSPYGTLVMNLDDQWVRRLAQGFSGRVVTYSARGPADVSLDKVEEKGTGGLYLHMLLRERGLSLELKALGMHNAMNALAAAAVGLALSVQPEHIKAGLEGFRPAEGRMRLYQLPGDIRLVDDSYNANPKAMEFSLRTVGRLSGGNRGRFIAVLGDMQELGEYSQEAHYRLGTCLAVAGADQAFYMGRMHAQVIKGAVEKGMDPQKIRVFEDHESMFRALKQEARPHDWILVKASRGVGLDRVVRAMRGEER